MRINNINRGSNGKNATTSQSKDGGKPGGPHGDWAHSHSANNQHHGKNILDGTVKGNNKYTKVASIPKPILKPLKHLLTSKINETINKVNELVLTLFK